MFFGILINHFLFFLTDDANEEGTELSEETGE